jgi:hypothetical protein
VGVSAVVAAALMRVREVKRELKRARARRAAQDCEEAESLDPKEFAAWFNQVRAAMAGRLS